MRMLKRAEGGDVKYKLEAYNSVIEALNKTEIPAIRKLPESLETWLEETIGHLTAAELNAVFTSNDLKTGAATSKTKKLVQLLDWASGD